MSISTSMGLAPLCTIDETAVPKFKQGVIISSFFLKFNTLVASKLMIQSLPLNQIS